MGKIARGTALAAALALGAGCSSTSTNEAGGGASSTGGTAGAGAASGGGAGAPSGGYLLCGKSASPAPQCEPLCGVFWPVCTDGLCTCRNTNCIPGTLVGCPSTLQCTAMKECVPTGNRSEGEACAWPQNGDSEAAGADELCQLGTECITTTTDAGPERRCRRRCDPQTPPVNCTCDPLKGLCQ